MKTDLIIIGAGPGGYEMAAQASNRGLNVVLIERDRLGGTCLNRGCIPTKTLCAAAGVLNSLKESDSWGITKGDIKVDYSVTASRKNQVVDTLREGVSFLLNQPNISIITGEAELLDRNSVKVGDDVFEAKNIVISTGSRPRMLPIDGAELTMTSDEILEMTELPASLCIIGGGVIGMEFAAIFSSFGVKVTVIEYCKEILPPFDKDIAKRLRQILSRRGVDIITQAGVSSIARESDNSLIVSYNHKDKPKSLEVEAALMCVGRQAVIPEGAENLPLKIGRNGIEVDDNMMTSVEGVYAIGDVNGRCMLAHAATAQGLVALNHITGVKSNINLDIVPSAVFTSPELAMVGLTEEQCVERQLDFSVNKVLFRSNGKAVAMGEPEGLMKMIIDSNTKNILGCHICGAHAADLIQEVSTVMNAGLTVDAISTAIHGHPTLSEVTAAASRF